MYNRGNVFLNISKFDEARADFDAALRLQSTRAKFYHAKGLAYEAQAVHIEDLMLANPTEPALDENGYPIQTEFEAQSPGYESGSPMLNRDNSLSYPPNSEHGRI